jgi:hypothetical protein
MECRLAQGKQTEVPGDNLPQRHFCPSQNPTWLDRGLNPGRRGGKPATNRLSYGAPPPYTLLFIITVVRSSDSILLPNFFGLCYFTISLLTLYVLLVNSLALFYTLKMESGLSPTTHRRISDRITWRYISEDSILLCIHVSHVKKWLVMRLYSCFQSCLSYLRKHNLTLFALSM